MERTREEIQAQIDILSEYDLDNFCEGLVEELEEQLHSAKSIEDLQREAFDAGRTNCKGNIDYEEYDGNVHLRPCLVKYNTAEDYINSNENEY